MKSNINNPKIMALSIIWNKYQFMIKGNKIIQNDIEQLMKYFRSPYTLKNKISENIISHLLMEIQETTEAEQRMDNESPAYHDELTSCQKQNFLFKSDLEHFYDIHIKPSKLSRILM